MSYLLFKETDKATGDIGMQTLCTSAIFNYQVIGTGAQVEFSGSNLTEPDVDNDAHWITILTLESGMADDEPFRQHCWNSIRYKVLNGTDVGIYVSSGVSG